MTLEKHLGLALILTTALGAGLPARVDASASLDRISPSSVLCGVAPSDFFRNVAPGTGGCDVGGAPVMDVPGIVFGLGFNDDVDGASNNETSPWLNHKLLFSVDRASLGVGVTPLTAEVAVGQAAGDVFRTTASPSLPPAGAIFGGVCAGPAFLPIGLAPQANQTAFNFVPTLPSGTPYAGPLDNLDALEISGFDVTLDNVHDLPIYFSLDRFSPALGLTLNPGDILMSPAGAPFFNRFARRNRLGLQPQDNVDALAVWDQNLVGTVEAGIDYALFSLDPISPSLAGMDGLFGTADDYSPADIFVTDFNGTFCVYVRYARLALLFTDNVDALDVVVAP